MTTQIKIFIRVVLATLFVIISQSLSLAVVLPDILTIDFGGTVSRWNINSSVNIFSRSTGAQGFGDMARMNDGRCLAYRCAPGGSFTGPPALFEINPDTGASNLVVQSATGAKNVIALTTSPYGDLFAYDIDLSFIRINPATLTYQTVPIRASNSATHLSTGGMATAPNGDIYAWASGFASGVPGVFSKLFKIDLNAGTALAIGGYDGLSSSQSFNAMAFSPDGRLFGFTEINGGINGGPFVPNGIYELNLNTGMPTLLGQRSVLAGSRGAVFVPEPTTLCLVLPLMLLFLTRCLLRFRNK
jgi:hypothetical protein